jgi:hypothetical protein
MERGSAKHAPRIDESIKRRTEPLERGASTEGRIEESRTEEGWSDGEPVVDDVAPVGDTQPGDVLASPDAADLRADIARYLARVIFPAARERLLDDAVSRQAPIHVVELLERLPEGRAFENVEQIWEALGGIGERRF